MLMSHQLINMINFQYIGSPKEKMKRKKKSQNMTVITLMQIKSINFSIRIIKDLFYRAFSLLLFPLSSLLDGNSKEKKRILIDFIPNLIATLIHSAIYCYADIVGLLHCGNQKVWKKTVHRVTTMDTNETMALEEVATTQREMETTKEEENEKN